MMDELRVVLTVVVALGSGLIGGVFFAFSTFDTDYLLVKEADFPQATAALRAAGHLVEQLEV